MPTNLPRIDELKRQLAQIDELAAQGVLGAGAAADARTKLERALVDAVVAPPANAEAAAVPPLQRPSRRLVAAVAAFVLVFGIAGYAWRGNFDGLRTGPGETVAAAEGDGEGQHGATAQQIETMVQRLVERLKAQPGDADGWSMLGRTYTALGRYPQALEAYRKVVELKPDDAQALADLADGIAVTNQRTLDGEPEKLIARAVQLDPKNVKALALAGTVAFNHDDFKGAAGYWQRAVDASEPNAEFRSQLQGALAEARQRAGMAPLAAAAPAPASAAAGSGRISGRVTLAPALRDRVAPGDTVFVFARAVAGPKMPLAILRKQASELPIDFTLDDSMAMSPAARLSSVPQVVVGARISKSGNAMPQAGDLQGLSAPVTVGSSGLQIEIGETVR